MANPNQLVKSIKTVLIILPADEMFILKISRIALTPRMIPTTYKISPIIICIFLLCKNMKYYVSCGIFIKFFKQILLYLCLLKTTVIFYETD